MNTIFDPRDCLETNGGTVGHTYEFDVFYWSPVNPSHYNFSLWVCVRREIFWAPPVHNPPPREFSRGILWSSGHMRRQNNDQKKVSCLLKRIPVQRHTWKQHRFGCKPGCEKEMDTHGSTRFLDSAGLVLPVALNSRTLSFDSQPPIFDSQFEVFNRNLLTSAPVQVSWHLKPPKEVESRPIRRRKSCALTWILLERRKVEVSSKPFLKNQNTQVHKEFMNTSSQCLLLYAVRWRMRRTDLLACWFSGAFCHPVKMHTQPSRKIAFISATCKDHVLNQYFSGKGDFSACVHSTCRSFKNLKSIKLQRSCVCDAHHFSLQTPRAWELKLKRFVRLQRISQFLTVFPNKIHEPNTSTFRAVNFSIMMLSFSLWNAGGKCILLPQVCCDCDLPLKCQGRVLKADRNHLLQTLQDYYLLTVIFFR